MTWETDRKTVEMTTTAPLPYLLIPVKAIQLQKLSLSDIQNFSTVCKNIDGRWQVFSS